MTAADPLINSALSNVRVIKHGLPLLKALMAVRAVKPCSEMANPSLFFYHSSVLLVFSLQPEQLQAVHAHRP